MVTEQQPTATEPADFASTSPLSPAPEPTAEAAPQETEPAPPPETGATPTEGSPEETPQPPAWAALPTVDEVLEHESVAPTVADRLKEATEEAHKKGRSEGQARLQPYLNHLGEQVKVVSETQTQFSDGWSAIVEQVEAGNFDRKEFRQLSNDPANKRMFEALSGVQQELGTETGAKAVIQNIANELKSQDFLDDFHPRVRQLVRDSFDPRQPGDLDPHFYKDLVSEIGSGVAKPLKAEIVELKAEVKKLEGEKRDIVRTNGKPPADVGGVTGGGSGQPANEQEARNWHATGKWSTRQIKNYLGRR